MINKLAVLIFKLVLYPWVYLKRRKLSPLSALKVKNILLVNTTGIGDTILSTPAWRALRNKFPEARLILLVHKRRQEVVANNSLADEVLTYSKFFSFRRLVKELRKRSIDAAVIFHANDPDVLPIIFLGRAKHIIGYKSRTRLSYFLTHPIDILPPHFIKAQMGLAEVLGAREENLELVFTLSKEEREETEKFLEKLGLKDKFKVGILPGAGRPYKRWPWERFSGVANHFLRKPGRRVIILGSAEERSLAQKVANLCYGGEARPFITAGELTLRETAGLLERLDLFIANDSGPVHMALALHVPTVALFCPSDPARLLPAGVPWLRIIKKEPVCQPCLTKKCRDPFCLEQISVEEVIRETEELLRENFTQ